MEEVAENFNCSVDAISIEKQFGEGKSGDLVYLINVSAASKPEEVGEYILKIAGSGDTDEFNHEISSTHIARQKCQSQKIKIPELLHFSPVSGYYVYDVAGSGAKDISSLYVQQEEKKRSRLEEFLEASLFAWQDCYSFTDATIQQMVKKWLGEKRLEAGSRLAERIRKLIHDELSMGWCMNGVMFPNPYYFFIGADSIMLRNVCQGPQHGDLNQKNIMIQPCGKGYEFYIIDFSHYQNQTFLFLDQAYLFLDVILDIDGLLLSDWLDNLQLFFDALVNGTRRIDNSGLFFKYANAFIGGWQRFFTHHPRNGKTLLQQLLCAFAVAGLNFMNKSDIPENKQLFSFVCASLALAELMRYDIGLHLEEDDEYPVLSVKSEEKISELWKVTDGFSQSTRFVLLSSCLESDIVHSDNFCALGFVPWTAIIEINDLLENDLRNKALQKFRQKKGYRHVLLSSNKEDSSSNEEDTWFSIVVDEEVKNKNIFYRKYIQPRLRLNMENIFARYEKYPICILVDSQHLDMSFCDNILAELLVAAGDNTYIDIIYLSDCESSIYQEDYIKLHTIICSLEQIALSIQMSFKKSDNDRVEIPTQDNGIISLDSNIVTEVENDMRIIYRNITRLTNDDQGEAFYYGNAATWHDIASHRDVERIDYRNTWHDQIKHKLERLHSSTSSLMWLYHKPGGGGSTMAKRIMWDFCTQFPTVHLQKISEKTSERLKILYKISVKPLLVIVEVSDSVISSTAIAMLRAELIRKNVRALFICILRANERMGDEPFNFYLPDTPKMNMTGDEAVVMYQSFSARLDPEQDQTHLEDLSDLTYTDKYSDELRQPFFYGLFAFGENYQKIEEYVRVNLQGVEETEKFLLMILAFNTIYSQTINLNMQEVAYILFPETVLDRQVYDKIRDVLSKNCFVVYKETGYRINHPLIAKKLLEQMFQKEYYSELIKLAKKMADCFGTMYSYQSARLDTILHELFIHREPITEEQRTVFSPFITELQSDSQRIEVMDYLRRKFPSNPHYSNHLARLYLNPQDKNQWPDIPEAKRYAQEAIERAESLSEDSGAIHHHLMGKVYTKECISQLRKDIVRNHITYTVQQMRPIYQKAIREFNICSYGKNSAYGIVGKLELVDKIFEIINDKVMKITSLVAKEDSIRGTLTSMIAEAGDVIHKYLSSQDEQSPAFRQAMLKFYEVMGKIHDIRAVFNMNEPNLRIRINSRRSIVTLLESDARDRNVIFSYDKLKEETLSKIKVLMEDNIYKDSGGSDSDRFRWFEAYRRLNDFNLHEAYKFMQEWAETSDALEVSYYQYIIAFLLYMKYQDITYHVVKEHLVQCQRLAQKAFGKNVTISRDLLGQLEDASDRDLLIPWQSSEQIANQENRDIINQENRLKKCVLINGSVSSIKDGVVEFRFAVEKMGNTLFYAKAPKVNEIATLLEGQQVQFHLGFSYSGFRAWDIIVVN